MTSFKYLLLLLFCSNISFCQTPEYYSFDYDEDERIVASTEEENTNLDLGEGKFLTRLEHLHYNLEKTIIKPFNLTGFPNDLAKQKPTKVLPSRPFKDNEYSIVKNLDRKSIKKVIREIKRTPQVLSYIGRDNKQFLAVQMGKKWMLIKGDNFKMSNIAGYHFTWVKFRDKTYLQLVCERDKNVRSNHGTKDALKWKSGKTLALLDIENRHFVLDFIFLNYDYRYITKEKIVKETVNVDSNEKEKIFINRNRSNQQSVAYDFLFDGRYNALKLNKRSCENKIVITSRFDKKSLSQNKNEIKLGSMVITANSDKDEVKLDEIVITITPPDRPCHELLMEGKYILTDNHFKFFK